MATETERFTAHMERAGIVFPYTTSVYVRAWRELNLPIREHVAVIDPRFGIDVITPWAL